MIYILVYIPGTGQVSSLATELFWTKIKTCQIVLSALSKAWENKIRILIYHIVQYVYETGLNRLPTVHKQCLSLEASKETVSLIFLSTDAHSPLGTSDGSSYGLDDSGYDWSGSLTKNQAWGDDYHKRGVTSWSQVEPGLLD